MTTSRGRSRKHPAADRGILAFRVLPDDEKIDIAGLAIRQRRRNARHKADRTKIDILIELAPKLQERAPERHVIGDLLGPADRTEEDRIVGADLALPILGKHRPVPSVVIVRREIERIEAKIKAMLLRGGFEHRASLRHDLLADSVARNNGDSEMVALSAIGHSVSRGLPPAP